MPGRAAILVFVVSIVGPVGCAAPVPAPPPPTVGAGPAAPGAGIIVAIRESPRGGGAIADALRAAGIGAVAPGAAMREYIVIVEGRGPVSVMQRDDDRLSVGDSVTLAAGPRTRIVRGNTPAPAPAASTASWRPAAHGNPVATTVASARRMV